MPIKHIARGYFLLLITGLLCSSYTFLPAFPQKKNRPSDEEGISVSNQYTVEQLVKDVFIKGGCKNVFNIQPIGNLGGIGYFENGQTSVSLEKGIILSTGPIQNAQGPNTVTDRTGNFGDTRGDIDLNRTAEEKVTDAVGIEFDFIPLDSTVSFSYVFASEEYCEFVDTKFNDVFGFFVSGPGINGEFSNKAKNVALIPATGDVVSINSVNHLRNSGYYVSNELREDASFCGIEYQSKKTHELIEYDGYTTVLTSTLNLIPCETYHIRLVVADRSDHFFDSAVFLGANSFNLGGEATIQSVANDPNGYVFEGCSDGNFVFERVNEETLSDSIWIPFKISPRSTAVEGTDFAPIGSSIVIPPGETSVSLPIEVFIDDLPESFDSLIIELDYPCECRTGEAGMILADPPELEALVPEQFICPGEEVELQPKINGGNGPFVYEWDNGDTSLNRKVAPTEDTRYRFKVMDNCGQEFETTTFVRLIQPAEATISGQQEFCKGGAAALSVSFTGEPPWAFTVAFPDSSSKEFSGIRADQNPFTFEVDQPGLYQLTSFKDDRCDGIALGQMEVKWSIVDARAEISPPSCHDKADGSIRMEVLSGREPFQFNWSDNSGMIQQTRTVGRGDYTVSITDGNGCTTSFEVEVEAPPPLGPVLYDCNNDDISLRSLKAQGGTPPYLYSVDGVQFSTSFLFEVLDPGTLYDLTIKDQQGCLYDQPFQLPTGIRDFVRLKNKVVLGLGDKYRIEPELLVPRTLLDSVSWYPEDNLTCSDCLDPILTAVNNDVYKMEVFDIFGCKDTATIEIVLLEGIQVFVPTAFSPNGDGINDLFQVFAKNSQINKVEVFQVFDRWGNLLHEKTDFIPGDQSAGWNGRINGKPVNAGTYIYNIILELVDGTRSEMKGSFLLMK